MRNWDLLLLKNLDLIIVFLLLLAYIVKRRRKS